MLKVVESDSGQYGLFLGCGLGIWGHCGGRARLIGKGMKTGTSGYILGTDREVLSDDIDICNRYPKTKEFHRWDVRDWGLMVGCIAKSEGQTVNQSRRELLSGFSKNNIADCIPR
jgi:hypothetical protein